MKRTCLFGVTFTMALIANDCARAEGFETRTMLAMIRNIEFITQNSSLAYSGQPLPEVVFVTEKELQRRAFSPEVQVAALKGDRSLGLVSALYDRQENAIFLADVNSIEGPSLFHELVHFLQNVNDKGDMFSSHRICLEAEAYELQAFWQTEQGIDLASRPEYGFVMTLYGACNDADFSWIDSAYRR